MRNRADIENDLSTAKKEDEKLRIELKKHEGALSSQVDPIKAEIAEKRLQIDEVKCQKASPVYTVAGCGLIVFAFVNMIFLHIGYLTWIALIAAVVFFIIIGILNKKLNKEYEQQIAPINSEISALERKIKDIEAVDPEISQIRRNILETDEKIENLSDELEECEVFELIGENNLIVSVDKLNYTHCYMTVDGKLINKEGCISTLIIDGKESGTIASPFSIIPLSSGIHTYSVCFNPGVDLTFTTAPIQFSTAKGNRFASFHRVDTTSVASLAKKMGAFNIKDNYDGTDLEAFLEHIGMSKAEFIRYVKSL